MSKDGSGLKGYRCLSRFGLALLLMLLATIPAVAQKRIALLIGNQSYTDAVGRLKNPHNDVDLIFNALKDIGFSADDVQVVKDADRNMLHSSLSNFQQKLRAAGENALGFFYYSGHGVADRSIASDGQPANYIIPIDVTGTEDLNLFFDRSVKLNNIVFNLRKSSPSADLIILFDACRDELKLGFKSLNPEVKAFIAEPVPYQGNTFVAFATSPNAVASDRGGNAGPFATALARELRKTTEHHEQVFFNVKRAVWEATGYRQRPWYEDLFLKRLYFATNGEEANRRPPDMDESTDQWKAILAAPSINAYKQFLERSPKSIYAAEAQARLRALEETVDWHAVSSSTKSADLEGFLKKYPYGAYSLKAREQLVNAVRAEEEGDWQMAKRSATADAFLGFIRKHPSAAKHAEAIDSLIKLRTSMEKAVFDKAVETAAWDQTQRADTVDSYEGYLGDYRDGNHASAARERIAILKEAKAWTAISSANSAAVFESFLAQFPSGGHAAEARSKIEGLRSMDVSAWQIAEATNTVEAYQSYLQALENGSRAAEARQRIALLQQGKLEETAAQRDQDAKISNLFFPRAVFSKFNGNIENVLNLKDAQPIRRLILSNDLSRLYSGGDDGALRIWDLNAIENTAVLSPRHDKRIYALERSANSKFLATAAWDRNVFLWDTHSNVRAAAIPVRPQVFAMTFSPTGRWIAAAGTNGQVDFISAAKKTVVQRRFITPSATIFAVAYLHNQSEDFVLGDAKGTLRLWTIRHGQEKVIVGAHSQKVLALTVDPNGTRIASAGADRKIKFWDANLNKISEISDAHGQYITVLRFLPEGQYMASGGGDHVVRIWNVKTGKQVHGPFAGHKGDVEAIEFSPDGKYMFTSSEDKTVRIWDVTNERLLYTLVAFIDGYIVYDDQQRYLASQAIESMLRSRTTRR